MLHPTHAARLDALVRELGEPMTCDGLTRDFVLFQRRRGHRHSTDDLLTAWYATAHLPARAAPRLLDLGSGIGSIGLAVLWVAQERGLEARLTAIEAQVQSFRLLQENIAANDVAARVVALHGDLRDASLLAKSVSFEVRHELAMAWLIFYHRHPAGRGIDGANKDADEYLEANS